MGKSLRAIVGALVGLVVVTGCGSGSGNESATPLSVASTGPSSTAASPPTSDPRTAAEFASDKAEAERAVLRLSDFPSQGWMAKPDTDTKSGKQKAAVERLGQCLGVDPVLVAGGAKGRATAESDNFTDEQDQRVENSVTVLPSPEWAGRQLAALDNPRAPACYEAFMGAALDSVASGDNVSHGPPVVRPLSLPGLSTDAVAYRATTSVTEKGQTSGIVLDTVLAVKGRTGITMTFSGLDTPLPADLETSLTNRAIDRAAD